MTGAPPFEVGALQVSDTWAFPGVALINVGAEGGTGGGDCGVAEVSDESDPSPTEFLAETL